MNMKQVTLKLLPLNFVWQTSELSLSRESQGGRSCAGARGAPAEKFGLGRKF